MHVGIFQLLPRPSTRTASDVIEQALWEVDFAERRGFESVWLTEHHLSQFGLIGAPSVYAAAIASRTSRIRIGYGVAIVPLHHPLRLAEEISWLDHLSRGRVVVGVGPGFSPYELGAFGVPLDERRERFDEGFDIVRRALSEPEISHEGRFWSIPRVTLEPRAYTVPHPPFFRAVSSADSARCAGAEGMPILLGLKSNDQLAELMAIHGGATHGGATRGGALDEHYVLRRIVVAPTDKEAREALAGALLWEHETALRVHEGEAARLADGSELAAARETLLHEALPSALCGSPTTVLAQIRDLHALGVRRIIGWFHFGDLPYAAVRRSMELFASEVLLAL